MLAVVDTKFEQGERVEWEDDELGKRAGTISAVLSTMLLVQPDGRDIDVFVFKRDAKFPKEKA